MSIGWRIRDISFTNRLNTDLLLTPFPDLFKFNICRTVRCTVCLFILLCYLPVALPQCSRAQAPARPGAPVPKEGHIYRHFGISDGLPNAYCNSLLRDLRGRVWTGTDAGLACYTGGAFMKYTTRNGLVNNVVSLLREDRQGIIYAGGATGITRFAGGYPGTFLRYLPIPPGSELIDFCVCDSSHIYYADHASRKLYLLGPKKRQAIMDLGEGSIGLTLVTDKQGAVFMLNADSKRLTLIEGEKVVKTWPLQPATAASLCLNSDYAGNTWLLMDSFIYRVNKEGVTVAGRIPVRRQTPDIAHFELGHDGIFYASAEVLSCLTGPAAGTSVHGRIAMYNGELKAAADGRLWAGTSNGLLLITPATYALVDTQAFFKAVMMQTAKGQVYMSMNNPALRSASIRKRFLELLKTSSYSYFSSDSTLWYEMQPTGMYYLKKGDKAFRFYTAKGVGAFDDFAWPAEDAGGNMWWASNRGVQSYQKGAFRGYNADNGFINNRTFKVAVDDAGNTYICTNGVYAVHNNSFEYISPALGVDKQPTYALLTDNRGRVWMKNNNEQLLCIGRRADGTYHAADSVSLSLSGRPWTPTGIGIDGRGNLWAVDNNVLQVLTPDSAGHYNDNRKIVLAGDEGIGEKLGNALPILWNGNDTMYLDRSEYASDPPAYYGYDAAATVRQCTMPPPRAWLSGLSIYGKPVNWAALGIPADINGMPVGAELAYRQRSLIFHYTATSPRDASYITYSYRLLGYETDWEAATDRTEAAYNNLSPGDYIFELKACDINNQWSRPLQYHFTILPPWYRTWWAYTLYFLLAGLALYSLFMQRIRALKRKATTERLIIEQQLKALRAQINPHFLQNTFDFLDQSLVQQPVAHTRRVIAQLSSYMRNVLYRTDETVLRLEDELIFAEEYLAINQLLFHNSFDYKTELGDEVDTIGLKVPCMILQPILENAVKHGVRHGESAEKKPLILLKITEEGHFLRCQVINTIAGNGVAAPVKEGYRSMGLENTRERLGLFYKNCMYKPDITMSASENDTFTVTITIPLA